MSQFTDKDKNKNVRTEANNLFSSIFGVMDLFRGCREKVLSSNGKTESDMKEYLAVLREWMKKEPHLPSDCLQDGLLELYLIKNKFSIEKTKSKIEFYCSMKSSPQYRYLFEEFPQDLPSRQSQSFVWIPNLTDDHCRVVFGKIWNEEEYNIKAEAMYALALREIVSRFDYNNGEIVVLDYSVCTAKIISKIRMNYIADSLSFTLKGFSARIKEIHVIGKFVNTILGIVKPFLPKKLLSRIHLHDDSSTLKDIIPTKFLPKDYGGEQKSLDELRVEIMDKVITDERENIVKYFQTKSREELRQGSCNDDMKGTFRKLNID